MINRTYNDFWKIFFMLNAVLIVLSVPLFIFLPLETAFFNSPIFLAYALTLGMLVVFAFVLSVLAVVAFVGHVFFGILDYIKTFK